MFMQRRSEFQRSTRIEIDEHADRKQDMAIRENAMRIRNIDAASRHVAMDYPELAGWYCLEVKDRREFSVKNVLEELGVDACVPSRKGADVRRRHRVIEGPVLPVISGYVLVRCVPSASAFAGLRGIRNVLDIVGRGGIPYRVPAKFVDEFKEKAALGAFDHRPTPHGYDVGMKVLILSGPFASFPATVSEINVGGDSTRINVEVHIFGREAPLEMDVSQIEPYCVKPKSVRVNRPRKIR